MISSLFYRKPCYFLFFPLAVVDHLTRFEPVFFAASDLEIFDATFLGRQAGYGLLDLPLAVLRPQALPVLTSVHSSPNHLPSPPLALGFFAFTFATFSHLVVAAAPAAAFGFVPLSCPRVSICRRVNFKL